MKRLVLCGIITALASNLDNICAAASASSAGGPVAEAPKPALKKSTELQAYEKALAALNALPLETATFEELEKANDSVEDALEDAVKTLSEEEFEKIQTADRNNPHREVMTRFHHLSHVSLLDLEDLKLAADRNNAALLDKMAKNIFEYFEIKMDGHKETPGFVTTLLAEVDKIKKDFAAKTAASARSAGGPPMEKSSSAVVPTAAGKATATKDLYNAAIRNDLEDAILAISNGADINGQHKEFGSTALIGAARYSIDVVKLLLKHNANLNLQNNDGRTALMTAAVNCENDIVKALLKANANPNLKDREGKTALILAQRNNCDEDIIQALKEAEKKSTTATPMAPASASSAGGPSEKRSPSGSSAAPVSPISARQREVAALDSRVNEMIKAYKLNDGMTAKSLSANVNYLKTKLNSDFASLVSERPARPSISALRALIAQYDAKITEIAARRPEATAAAAWSVAAVPVAARPALAVPALAVPALAVPAAPVDKLTIKEREKVEALKKQIATSRDATVTKMYQAQSDLILAKAGMAISGEEAVADKLAADEKHKIEDLKKRISASKNATTQGTYLQQIRDIITAAKKRK